MMCIYFHIVGTRANVLVSSNMQQVVIYLEYCNQVHKVTDHGQEVPGEFHMIAKDMR